MPARLFQSLSEMLLPAGTAGALTFF